jgi:GNAT superfamily N-acetyltransferase
MKLRIVKPSQGLFWVRQGLLMARKQPFNLVGLLGMVACAALLLIGLPIVGPLLVVGLMPIVWMGFMLATRRALAGERVTPSVFIEPLRSADSPRQAFAKLGGAYVLATLVVMQLAQLLGPGAEVLSDAFEAAKDTGEVLANPLVQQDVLWRMGLTLPVSLLFWHTPALVLWARMPVGKALFFSAVASWRNLGAFTVYGLAWGGVMVLLGLVTQLLGGLLGEPTVVSVLALSMGMWVAASFYASLYFTVIDCFDAPDADPNDQADKRVTPSSGQA